jgi:hypothetical protein
MWKPLMLRARAGRAALTGMIALTGGLVVTGGLVLAPAGTASAVLAPEWHVQYPPNPAGTVATGLSQDSCPSPSFCLAVGLAEDNGGSVFPSFAETWNGKSWTIRKTYNAVANVLDAVSCRSKTFCMTVGDIARAGNVLAPLAERWSGSGWADYIPPRPSGAVSSFLTGVSCPSTTYCQAVGFWEDSSLKDHTLAEIWSNGTWKITPTVSPPGFGLMELTGVACASASSCVAPGFLDNHGYSVLAESWNGRSWSRDTIKNPDGGANGYLADVSCYSATGCLATGDYSTGTVAVKNVPLAEWWNGHKWTARKPAVPAGSNSSGLVGGVSCPSASACTATGFKVLGGKTKLLAERWNGHGWQTQDIKAPPGSQNITELSAVSCPAPSLCLAVGSYTSSAGDALDLGELYS